MFLIGNRRKQQCATPKELGKTTCQVKLCNALRRATKLQSTFICSVRTLPAGDQGLQDQLDWPSPGKEFAGYLQDFGNGDRVSHRQCCHLVDYFAL